MLRALARPTLSVVLGSRRGGGGGCCSGVPRGLPPFKLPPGVAAAVLGMALYTDALDARVVAEEFAE